MCQCDPRIRTPFCGRDGCEWPETYKTFAEAMIDAAKAGELTESSAREWLDGDDLEKALAIIHARAAVGEGSDE